jgi:protein dithiol oxidoreductase (disulfide-forming)
MRTRLVLAPLLLSALLLACSGDDTPDAAAPATATPAATTAPAPDAPEVEGAPAVDGEAATPADAPATTEQPEQATPDPAAAQAAAAASAAASQGPGPVAGTDYVEIPGGQPYAPLEGKIEVAEVFAYWCGACAQFDPLVSAWEARLPDDVRFTYVPAVFSPQDNFPRAFFAAETAGVLKRTHAPLFAAIHLERSLRQNASVDDIAAFYGRHGVDAGQMKSTMQSFAINAKLNRAKQFAIRSGVEGTPTMVVNGKYRVLGRTHEDALRITEQLIARERAARAGGAQ